MFNYEIVNECFKRMGDIKESDTTEDVRRKLDEIRDYLIDTNETNSSDETVGGYEANIKIALTKESVPEEVVHFLVENMGAYLSRQETLEECEEREGFKRQNEAVNLERERVAKKAIAALDIEYKAKLKSGEIKATSLPYAVNKDYIEAVTAIKNKFEANKSSEAEVFTKPVDKIKQESLEMRRVSLQNFLSIADESLFVYMTNPPKSLLHKMVGVPMTFGAELLKLAIERTPDVKDYSIYSVSGNGSRNSQEVFEESELFEANARKYSLLEYFIREEGAKEDEKSSELNDVAIMLAEKGCIIDPDNDEVIEYLFRPRAINSGLTAQLCNYFITKGEADLFFAMVNLASPRHEDRSRPSRRISLFNYQGSSRSSSVAASVTSRSSSRQSASDRALMFKKIHDIFEGAIENALEIGVINKAKSSKTNESIPAFLLRRNTEFDNKGAKDYMEQMLWNYMQAAHNIEKLNIELFKNNSDYGTMLHQAARIPTATIVNAFANIINNSSEDRDEIYGAKDSKGRTPFHLACEKGFDGAIKVLMKYSPVNELDGSHRTPLIAAIVNGKAVSVEKLLSCDKIDIESKDSPMRPLCAAVMHRQETIAKALLEKGANPNAVSYIVDDNGGRYTTCLEEALRVSSNHTNIQILVRYGAKTKDGNGNYIAQYLAYKRDPKNKEFLAKLEEAEKDAAQTEADFVESIQKTIKNLREFQEEIGFSEEVLVKMEEEAKNGDYRKAFDIYNEEMSKQKIEKSHGERGGSSTPHSSRPSSITSSHHSHCSLQRGQGSSSSL